MVTLITDSDISPPTTPVRMIFVAFDGNDKTLPLSCVELYTSFVFSSMAVTVIIDAEISPPKTPVGVICVASSDVNDKTLPLSCTVSDTSAILSSIDKLILVLVKSLIL